MKFYILPRTNALGIHYVVASKTLFRTRYLDEFDLFRSGDNLFVRIEQFHTPEEATRKVRELFGATARIATWQPGI